MINLGEEQLNALSKIKEFITSSEIAIYLAGYAGTGKSTLTGQIVEFLEQNYYNYVLCAPTHKAKTVLERFTGKEGITLHKLLSLTPNIEIFDLDFKDLKFSTSNKGDFFPRKGIIICDESSMINDELYELLLFKCKKYECKIIFCGDKGQIQPVNAKSYSKVFELKNGVTLTKIYRQSSENGLSAYLPTLRENFINNFSTVEGTEGSVYCFNNIRNFFKEIVPVYKKAIRNADILETKILTYTNARVEGYNQKVRELLFKNNNQYNKFEFLTGYENLSYNGTDFWNSMDYIIIDEPKKIDLPIANFMKLPAYELNLYNSSNKETEKVCILDKNTPKDYIDSLCSFIEDVRFNAISLKFKNKKLSNMKWKIYFETINSFTSPKDLYFEGRLIRKKSFDFGYASSTHKSQGSTYNNVFVDIKDLMVCRDPEELRQLQYVALSRAKNNVYILQ